MSRRRKRKVAEMTPAVATPSGPTLDMTGLSDVEVAIQMLEQKFPTNAGMPPLVTLHQLYATLKSNSKVDTGVDELRRQHKLRHVMLGNFGTGREFAVVREEVYTSMIQYRITKFEQAAAAKRAKQNKSKVDASADQSILSMSSGPTLLDKAQLLRNFKQYFVPAHWDVQVNSEYLLDVVYREHQTDPITGAPLFKQLQEAQVITVLIQADLLLRKVNNSSVQTVFWVRLPQMTPLLREMKKARQTIVSIVKRTQYKEIKLAALRAKRLNQSYMFTLLFHLKDMLGGNLLRVVATASGPVVRTVD